MDKNSVLKNIPVDQIKPNPVNPRFVFRQEEMDSLLVSIKKNGIQVPISVYKDGNNYVLIDGERRWRTCLKLNFEEIPAIIQKKPTDLENLLMMFNIHALREQWDLFTIANKLTDIIKLLVDRNGYYPTESQINEETGLTRSTIRRCKVIIDLPDKYKGIVLEELKKPKAKQKLTEDFFIEMETSLKRVRNTIPELLLLNSIDKTRDTLIKKYQTGIIKNVLDFRKIAKLTTAPKKFDYPKSQAIKALTRIFSDNNEGIDDIFNSTVSNLYMDRKLLSNFTSVLSHIEALDDDEKDDEQIVAALKEIRRAIDNFLKG